MCDNGIITERRFMELVVRVEPSRASLPIRIRTAAFAPTVPQLGVDISIESKVATKELLQLAILWGVTRSSTDFWQTHRSRAELVEGLQRAKASLDTDAKRQQEVQEREVDAATAAHDMTEEQRTRQRRTSLVSVQLPASCRLPVKPCHHCRPCAGAAENAGRRDVLGRPL